MLTITFLGHQGWMFGAGGAHILVDPLLDPSFGVRPEAGLLVYPPRRLDVTAAPRISAVMFTHEHDDHFQIASLARIDRRTPILLSSRTSSAAAGAAAAMGFEVRRLDAEEVVRFGELELRTLAVDLLHGDCADEWDVLPFAVRDLDSNGSFMSCVDLPPNRIQPRMLSGANAPTVVGLPNNFSSNHALTSWMPPPAGALPIMPQMQQWMLEAAASPLPDTILLSGGGWSFSGPLAWLNRSFFPADTGAIVEALARLNDGRRPRLRAPRPGETIVVEGKQVRAVDTRHEAFIAPLPAAEWPDRRYDPTLPRAARVEPMFGDAAFTDADLPRLRERLRRLARAMVGGRLNLGLNSLSNEELGPHRRAYALFAQTDHGGGGYLFEYSPRDADFLPASDEVKAYAAGASVWAQDLMAGLGGELTGVMLSMGRMYEWIRCQPRRPNNLTLAATLWPYAHPLQMPDEFLALYRALAARIPDDPRLPPPP